MKLSINDNSKNYACSVVEIKNIFPIEGADNIVRTNVNGNDVVVSKDTKIGDIMLYFVSGTRLNQDYCKYNNLLDKAEMNNDINKRGLQPRWMKIEAAFTPRGGIRTTVIVEHGTRP